MEKKSILIHFYNLKDKTMKKVYLLRHRSAVIMISSNLKTCYESMLSETPAHLHKNFRSYSQVTRVLHKTQEAEFPLPDRDWYYIEKRKVLTKFAPQTKI